MLTMRRHLVQQAIKTTAYRWFCRFWSLQCVRLWLSFFLLTLFVPVTVGHPVAGDLDNITSPLAQVSRNRYAAAPATLAHLLTSYTDASGTQQLRNVYDAQKRGPRKKGDGVIIRLNRSTSFPALRNPSTHLRVRPLGRTAMGRLRVLATMA